MTFDNVELVRNAFEKYANGETAAIAEIVDPDLEWTFLDLSVEDPSPQICRGREQLIYWMNRRSENGRRSSLEEVAGHGERVLTVIRTPGIDDSRVRKTGDLNYYVLTVRDGSIVKLRACRNREEAVAIVDFET